MNMSTANEIPKTEAVPFVIMRVDDGRWERCSYASKRDISAYKEHKHKKSRLLSLRSGNNIVFGFGSNLRPLLSLVWSLEKPSWSWPTRSLKT